MSPQNTTVGSSFLNGGGETKVTLGWELEFNCPNDAGGGSSCPTCYGEGYNYFTCPVCNGDGEVSTYVSVECPGCEGQGEVTVDFNGSDAEIECPMCNGCGTIDDYEVYVPCDCNRGEVRVDCPDCDGTGSRKSEYNYNISDVERYGELKEDCSIHTKYDCWGAEFASDVLRYGQDDIVSHVNDVMDIINECGGDADPYNTCGLHVHVAPKGGWTLEHAARLARAWYNWGEEYFIDEFEPLRSRMEGYCTSWRESDFNIIRQAKGAMKFYNEKFYVRNGREPALDDSTDERRKAIAIKYLGVLDTRYVTLNFTAHSSHGTVEFRLFNGTNDPDEVLKALDWVAKIVIACEAGSDGSKERFLQLIGRGTVLNIHDIIEEQSDEQVALAL